MPLRFRDLAGSALDVVRRYPAVHRPVHAVAVRMTEWRWGQRFIRSVLEPESLTVGDYKSWIAHFDKLKPADRTAIAEHIGRMKRTPMISVVMPAYATPPKVLKAAIESVRGQLYPHWELCVADDGSPGEAVWKVLSDYAAQDPRIKVVRREASGHVAAATNSALALASGEFVALMDHDDLLREQSLYEIAALLERHPDADLIYTDEDKIDDKGVRFEPYFKTDWNPELMLGQNMVSHLGVYWRALVEELGGLREGFEGSQDYDLTLRVSEKTTRDRIHHIPWVLYHWRQQGKAASFSETRMAECAASAKRAVEEHLARTGVVGATVVNKPDWPGWLHVRRAVPEPKPLVSIIVPTRDRADLLEQCARGVLQETDYGPLELIIVDNGSEEAETHALFKQLRKDKRVRILDAPGPFNFSALNNRAAREARGDVLVLLNNDIGVREPHWLDELVSHAIRPQVGAVGAKLLYPDGSVQHAGVILGVGADPAVAGHAGHGQPQAATGYFGRLALACNVSAVTAACLALRRSVFEEVGGLDEKDLKIAFNDVDLCLKIRAAGYDIIWTPLAELDHHESASRGSDIAPEKLKRFQGEIRTMRKRWGKVLDTDPFYGPLFNKLQGDYTPAIPPRRTPPWASPPARTGSRR
jgi:glycosyltransferase involved in cell wall biosynthesis